MNEKEMLMKQLRANAFPHNNGKVMQAINICLLYTSDAADD